MFLGLRKTAGVSHAEFNCKFKQSLYDAFGEVIQQEVQKGVLEADDQGVRLTRKGRFIGNEVFQQFLL